MNNLYLLNQLTVKELLTKKTQGTHTFIGKLYQFPNKEIPVVHKIFQNIQMTRAFFNPFTQDYQNSFGQNTRCPKQTKNYKARKR
jgi:hypothetical protein